MDIYTLRRFDRYLKEAFQAAHRGDAEAFAVAKELCSEGICLLSQEHMPNLAAIVITDLQRREESLQKTTV